MALSVQEAASAPSPASPAPAEAMTAVSSTFTLLDLRLFHHFLCFAHPPLPLGNQSAWTQDIPQLSHHSDHLMSALLSFSAAHFTSRSPNDQHFYTALMHKGRAMAGLRETCAKGQHSAADYDAMLATCYALTFQCALLPGEALEFAVFVRGCAMVTERIQRATSQSVFNNVAVNSITAAPRDVGSEQLGMASYPPGSQLQVLLSKGVVSLYAAQACIDEPCKRSTFFDNLRSIFVGFLISPRAGYDRFFGYYTNWFKFAADRKIFSGRSTGAGPQLLWAHFIALQLFTALLVAYVCGRKSCQQYLTVVEDSAAARSMMAMVEWIYAIEAVAPTLFQKHLTWPMLVSSELLSRFDIGNVSEVAVRSKVVALGNFTCCSHNVFGDILGQSASLANWTAYLLTSKKEDDDEGNFNRLAQI